MSTLSRKEKKISCFRVFGFAFLAYHFLSSFLIAHPADTCQQSMAIRFTPMGFSVEWVISPGSLLVRRIWAEANTSGSELNPDIESLRRLWVMSRLDDVVATLNGENLPGWRLDSMEWPASVEDFGMDKNPIKINISARIPSVLDQRYHLTLDNQYLDQISVTWFYLYGEDGALFLPPKQKKGKIDIEAAPLNSSKTDDSESDKKEQNLLDYWESGTPSLPGFVENLGRRIAEDGGADMKHPQQRGAQAILTGFMRSTKASLGFYLAAFGIAFILGALHAVTPGHGKTIMAAYLVGAHGKLWHAFALGSIVTFTHTGSVFFLGLATLVASKYIMPESLFPILQISSGILILIFGVYFLRQRWRAWRSGKKALSRPDSSELAQTTSPVTLRAMTMLGVSSGLVPCPGATTILLTAVSINRILLGLTLIAFFSVGLAGTLIVIGAAMVQGRRLFDKIGPFQRFIPVMPVISAILLLFLGAFLTINAVRVSLAFLPSSPSSALAQSREDGVLYLSFDQKRRRQIFLFSLRNDETHQITTDEGSVMDYSLSPDGTRIVYTLLHKGSRSDIFLIDTNGFEKKRLTSETDASFSRPVWAPDGNTIVYERMDYNVNSAIAAPSLWWLDYVTGDSGPLFQDDQLPCRYPSWSSDGKWLSYCSYFSASRNSLLLYNLEDGRRIQIPSKPQGFVSWQPFGNAFVFTELRPSGYDIKPTEDQRFARRLLRYDVSEQKLVDPCKGKQINDISGVWSPDGKWIAVIRRELSGSLSGLGQQLWIIKPDGSEPQMLTRTPDVYFGSLVWTNDGKSILFNRWPSRELSSKSELWSIDIETKKMRMIASAGSWGEWISNTQDKIIALKDRHKSNLFPSAE